MRRLVGEKELQLLTVGNQTYSGDSRYAVHYQYPHNWRLKITKPQVTDEGTYACQISTHPPRIIQYNLHINGEWALYLYCIWSCLSICSRVALMLYVSWTSNSRTP